MNTTQLVAKVAKTQGLSKTQAKQVVSSVLDTIQTEVQKGKRVALSGFGIFSRARRKARTGRNPQTGDLIRIEATRYPRFKPGKAFKQAVK